MSTTSNAISSKPTVGTIATRIAIIGGVGTSVIPSARTPALLRIPFGATLAYASPATTMRTAQNAARSASILMIKPRTTPFVRANAPANPIVPTSTLASILATPSNASQPKGNAPILSENHAIEHRSAHKVKRA